MPPIEEAEDQIPEDDAELEAGADGEEAEQVDPEVEAEAKRSGWVPKERFRGNPDDWVPAAEFVRRGKEIAPIIAAENRKLKQELADLKETHAKEYANLRRMSDVALKNQRKQLEQQFEAVEAGFVEQGNTKGFQETKAAKAKALKEFDEAVAEKKEDDKAEKANGADPDVADWVKSNPWFNRSPMLNGAANEIFDELKAEMPDASNAEILAEVTERVKEQFPDRFPKAGNGARNGRSRVPDVEGAGERGGGSNGSTRLFGKLPAEARKQADEFIREQKLFLEPGETVEKNLGAARERYAKAYLEGANV